MALKSSWCCGQSEVFSVMKISVELSRNSVMSDYLLVTLIRVKVPNAGEFGKRIH